MLTPIYILVIPQKCLEWNQQYQQHCLMSFHTCHWISHHMNFPLVLCHKHIILQCSCDWGLLGKAVDVTKVLFKQSAQLPRALVNCRSVSQFQETNLQLSLQGIGRSTPKVNYFLKVHLNITVCVWLGGKSALQWMKMPKKILKRKCNRQTLKQNETKQEPWSQDVIMFKD